MLLPLVSQTLFAHSFLSPEERSPLDKTEVQQGRADRPKLLSQMVQINFEDLQAFERVTDQYERLGVIFEQAIAIEPSNPAFHSPSGCLVLMPLTPERSLSVAIARLSDKVGADICGAKPVAMTAFDAEGNILCHSCSCACYSRTSDQQIPQQRLEIEDKNIAKVMFHSEAPFTVDRFFFADRG